MKTFSTMDASKKLRTLARAPVNLTEKKMLTSARMEHYSAQGAHWKLLYGAQRINDDVMEALFELAEESKACQQFAKMLKGEIVNTVQGYDSEKRPVLHTACRDFFKDPIAETAAVRARAFKECEKLKAFLEHHQETFADLVVIGIGGSHLGPEALYQSLAAYYKKDRFVHFISNIDPDNLASVFASLDLSKTLVVVNSKSGSTLETQTNEAFARNQFTKSGLNPKNHFIGITTEGSIMDDPAEYLEMFYIWEFIGGRFCGTAMPGGIIIGFACGFSVYWELLRGANAMDQLAASEDVRNNIPLLLALLGIWNRNFLHHPYYGVIPYAYALRRFGAHVQQVDMESNGKRVDQHGHSVDFGTSPVVLTEPGTNAQHSFFQMIHQGTEIVPMEFIGFKESQLNQDYTFQQTSSQQKLLSNLLGQVIALAKGKSDPNPNRQFLGNRPSLILLADKLTPEIMGALYALYEHKMAFQGFIWQINSFDQEGVSLGKKLATQILGYLSHAETSEKSDETALAAWFFK